MRRQAVRAEGWYSFKVIITGSSIPMWLSSKAQYADKLTASAIITLKELLGPGKTDRSSS